MVKGPLRRELGSLGEVFWGELRRVPTRKLCERLGVEFTEVESEILEMWAEIGERLALEQPEFKRPKKQGRPQKLENQEVRIAELVECPSSDDLAHERVSGLRGSGSFG